VFRSQTYATRVSPKETDEAQWSKYGAYLLFCFRIFLFEIT
jgi:hypothetical protein